MANRAKENRIERPQLLQPIGGHHPSGLDVRFATPIESVPAYLEAKATPSCLQDADALRNNFLTDSIPRDDCNVESFHVGRSLFFPNSQQRVQIGSGIERSNECHYFSIRRIRVIDPHHKIIEHG
jgi:hypothetical protein